MRSPAWALVGIPIASALMSCELLVDTDGLSGSAKGDGGSDSGSDSSVVGPSDGGLGDTGTDAPAGDAGATPLFDPGSTWPISTSMLTVSPTTPPFNTSAACTDVLVLANSGIPGGSTATASISTNTGMTFNEVVKDTGHNADTVYIWKASNSCASRSGTVSINWTLTGGDIFWSNVAVFAFTHSKGIGAAINAHNPGNTSINTISITPSATGSWVFASLTGNNSKDADAVGTAGDFLQTWSGEGAIHTYGPAQIPAGTTAGTPVTFSLTSPDTIWASAAAELLSL